MKVVKEWWLITRVHALHYKLMSLKPILKDWNKNIFGDITINVETTLQKLEEEQLILDQQGYGVEREDYEIT